MKFKHFKWSAGLLYLIVACMVPVLAYVSAEGDKWLPCINAMTIEGLVFLILGVISSLMAHGDFDITEYVTRRFADKKHTKSFEAFKADKKEKREDHFNYPLFTGILMLIASAVLSSQLY